MRHVALGVSEEVRSRRLRRNDTCLVAVEEAAVKQGFLHHMMKSAWFTSVSCREETRLIWICMIGRESTSLLGGVVSNAAAAMHQRSSCNLQCGQQRLQCRVPLGVVNILCVLSYFFFAGPGCILILRLLGYYSCVNRGPESVAAARVTHPIAFIFASTKVIRTCLSRLILAIRKLLPALRLRLRIKDAGG